ncbi:ArsR/SmtB family transcription factor [Leifsonia aquatica]|uniref:ArsR/SmtB family transcription factor n=1 Tax=Leifsonia aquatica TaxID=144185 RepID=UPI000693CEFC|nr:metalloregulator ArsR/SmtB family transcription factor [Leifsonia aquatica]
MIDNSPDTALDAAFAALADPVRRAIVARLSRGPATVGELAEPFDITLQAVSKHIGVLEAAGLVWRTREAQRRPVHLDAAALERLTSWIDRYRLEAEARYRRLDAVLRPSSGADRRRTNTSTSTSTTDTTKEKES